MGLTIDPLWINVLVLIIAFFLEGYFFLVALTRYLLLMRRDGQGNPFSYLLISDDPTLVAVVLEDSVAMLGMIAFYLGRTNMRFLTDIRDNKAVDALLQVVQEHHEVERIHDLRSIVVDERNTILVAEIELREEAIVPGLQERITEQQNQILQQIPSSRRNTEQVICYAKSRAAVQVTLARAEQIIDELEAAVKQKVPRVSHITLEVEGISSMDPERDEPEQS